MPKIIYTNGCLDKLKEVIEGNVAALGGIGVGIAVIQVRALITRPDLRPDMIFRGHSINDVMKFDGQDLLLEEKWIIISYWSIYIT